jgi:phosphatidylserine decarboxylase
MKPLRAIIGIVCVVALSQLLLPAIHSTAALAEENNHQPITQKLIDLVGKNPEIGLMLETSIAEAKEANPDLTTNPVQSLSDYYNFVDRVSELLPQEMIECSPSLTLRDQMLQGLCYFYFLVDQPLAELEGKGLFNNTLEYYQPFSAWLVDLVKTQGAYLSTKQSWNEELYQTALSDPEFGLDKGWYESPSNWHTFNQFFARYLKSPDMRPIASPDDPSVVTSPADSVPQGVWPIDKDSNIQVEGGLKVKLITYFNVHDLLGKDSAYKDAFANGVLTHTFLNVNDYHRYHFAVGGIIKEKEIISQNVALEVTWDKEQGKYIPVDSTGWQFTQTRGCVIVDTGEYGLVALIPMGMAQVSSVNFEDYVQVGASVNKGDMLGNFLFGGSDFIMLFQQKAGFEITAPMENSTDYQHILVGTEYGIMKPAK